MAVSDCACRIEVLISVADPKTTLVHVYQRVTPKTDPCTKMAYSAFRHQHYPLLWYSELHMLVIGQQAIETA